MQKLTPHNKFADTLLRKTGKMSQKFTVLAEFSAVLAEFSTSIAKNGQALFGLPSLAAAILK